MLILVVVELIHIDGHKVTLGSVTVVLTSRAGGVQYLEFQSKACEVI